MSKLYSETLINEVLDRTNIIEVIASYIPLKRAGRNYKANCPFHPEKTPSFIVSSDKQIYHCFGCGVGGNALTFVMQYEKVNFIDALKTLAQKGGIPLPEPEKTQYQKTNEDAREGLYKIYQIASDFFHYNLLNSPEAKKARIYLQKRGISKETASKFSLGFAMPQWDSLLNHLRSKNIKLSLIERSGLVVAKESGGYYDRFRDRIIFPISNIKGKTIAFGGRVLTETMPKYINSPESSIYTKGKNLFGLDISKESIRTQDSCIIVEGYLDMIAPFEAGITNIAASLGTALTVEQIRLIKRYTNNVILLYDPDFAGELATLRALELLIKEEINVKIVTLPDTDDPDSYVRKNGKDKFAQIIKEAKPIFDYKLSVLLSKFDSATTYGKENIVREILPTIKKFTNASARADYIKRLSQTLDIREEALYEDLKNASEDYSYQEKREIISIDHYKLTEIPVTERMLVKLMLEEIHNVEKIKSLINPSDFREEVLRKIVKFIFDFFSQGKECKPNIIINYLGDDDAINIISELAALEIHDCTDKEKLISDCVIRLKRDNIIHRCHELHNEIKAAQESGNHDKIQELIAEYNMLIKQRSKFHG